MLDYVRRLSCPECQAEPEQACFNVLSGKNDLVKNHIERIMAYFDSSEEAVQEARLAWSEIYEEPVEEMKIKPESLDTYDWVLS